MISANIPQYFHPSQAMGSVLRLTVRLLHLDKSFIQGWALLWHLDKSLFPDGPQL